MTSTSEHKTKMLWLAGLLHAFTHIYHVALMPLYLLIQRDFNLSVSQTTLLVTIMMAAYFVPSYFMGVAADKLSRKKLLGWGLAINGLGFVLLALAPNYPLAVAAMIIAGFGGSFYHPAATAMVARLCPVGTGKALGLVGIGASAGFFVAPIYTGWRATMLQPLVGDAAWRRPILELGLLGVVMAFIFAWLAVDVEPSPAEKRKAEHKETIFPTAALWLIFLAGSFAFSLRDFTGTSMGSLGSLFLQKAHGYNPKITGFALSGIFLASAISNPLFGHLSDKGRIRWTTILLLIAAVAVGTFPHLPSSLFIPAFAVYGFFFMASYPVVEAMLMESVPDAVRGRVFGLFITVGGLIGNLSHWLVGAWVKNLGDAASSPHGYFGIYATLAGFVVASLLGLPALHAIRKREEPELAREPAHHEPTLHTPPLQ